MAFTSTGHPQLIDLASSPHRTPGAQNEPHLIGGEGTEKKGVTICLMSTWTFFLSLRMILKSCFRLSSSKAPSRQTPGNFFIQPMPFFFFFSQLTLSTLANKPHLHYISAAACVFNFCGMISMLKTVTLKNKRWSLPYPVKSNC